MRYTSATFASALCNVVPALTFLMACICGLEKVNLKKLQTQEKVAGAVVTVAGAMFMTLYKGPILGVPWSRGRGPNSPQTETVGKDMVKGSLMITTGCFCCSCFVVIQAITPKTYRAELSLTVLICFTGTVEGMALAMESGSSSIWTIGWDMDLFAVTYAGIFCSGIAYYVQGVIMPKRGPVFVTAFSPLSMVIVAISGSFILKEEISLGRVLGALIIVAGLYFLVWGMSNDHVLSSRPIDKQVTARSPPTARTDATEMNVSEPQIP